MKTLHYAFATLVLAATLAVSSASAQQDVTCTSQLTNATFRNVTVPPNATCTLSNVAVQGNVTVRTGARLSTEATTINGSINANNAAQIFIDTTSIDGNVNAQGTAQVEVFTTLIEGNLIVSGASFISINGDEINGNLNDRNNNTGAGNTNIITNNQIGGNLICQKNTPPPVNPGAPIGGPNVVSGNKIGQCEGLS